ncbi:aldehyde dehydrogenase family protein [Bacillus sp. SL00103]
MNETTNADIPLAIEHMRYYAGWTTKISGQTIPVSQGYFNYTRHEPVGVVGQIIPWNFRYLWPCGKWVVTFATGRDHRVKTSRTNTPLCTLFS